MGNSCSDLVSTQASRTLSYYREIIDSHPVVVFGVGNAPSHMLSSREIIDRRPIVEVKNVLQRENIEFHYESVPHKDRKHLRKLTKMEGLPQCYVLGSHVGGAHFGRLPWQGMLPLIHSGALQRCLETNNLDALKQGGGSFYLPRYNSDHAGGLVHSVGPTVGSRGRETDAVSPRGKRLSKDIGGRCPSPAGFTAWVGDRTVDSKASADSGTGYAYISSFARRTKARDAAVAKAKSSYPNNTLSRGILR